MNNKIIISLIAFFSMQSIIAAQLITQINTSDEAHALSVCVLQGDNPFYIPPEFILQCGTLKEAVDTFDQAKIPVPDTINMPAIIALLKSFNSHKDKIGKAQLEAVEQDVILFPLTADLLQNCLYLNFKNGIRLIVFHLIKKLTIPEIVAIQRAIPEAKIPLRHYFYLLHPKAPQKELAKLQAEPTFSLLTYRDCLTAQALGIFGRYLDLHKKGIKSLGSCGFLDLKDVAKLDLSDNFIQNIKLRAFAGLSALVELNLSNNKLTHIKPEFFQGLDSLQDLRLENNPIIEFDATTLTQFPIIRQLTISKNLKKELIDMLSNSLKSRLPHKYVSEATIEFRKFQRKQPSIEDVKRYAAFERFREALYPDYTAQ